MHGVLSFQPRIPGIHHAHTVVAPHSVYIPTKRGEPSSSKSSASTSNDRVNHSHIIWIQICQPCHLKVIVEEPHVVMLLDRIKESLIALCEEVKDTIEVSQQIKKKLPCNLTLFIISYHP